jgi:hypothetical protein
MTRAAEALSAAQRTEYAASGRADLDRRLARLSPAEREAFWTAVGRAYVPRPPEQAGAAPPRRAPSPLLQEAC